jgi:formate dehydrogenase iron-sulfur subunit
MASREMELAGLPQTGDPPRGLLAAILGRLIKPFRRGVPPEPRPPTGFFTDTTVCIGCKACEVACKAWNELAADGFYWSGNSYDHTGTLSATSWRHVKFIEQFSPVLPLPLGEGGGEGSCEMPPAILHPNPLPEGEGTKNRSLPAREWGEGGAVDPKPSGMGFSLDVLLNETKEGRWLMMSDVCKHRVTAPCQQACPTGAIIHTEFDNVFIQPDICNGCSSCVAACPFGAITRSSVDGHSHKCTLCYECQRDGLVPACAKACPTQSIQFGPIDELRERARGRVEDLHSRGVTSAYLYGDTPSKRYSELNSFYLLVDRPSVYGLPDNPFNPWLHMKGDYIRAIVSGLTAIAALLAMLFLLGN